MKKKLSLNSFSGSILKADVTKNIMGGYGSEGTASSTSQCTQGTAYGAGGYPIHWGDTSSDGDYYSSC